MSGNIQVQDFLEFKDIILEVKLSNKFKNDHENFSEAWVVIVMGLLA
jgi:hypothetical protein